MSLFILSPVNGGPCQEMEQVTEIICIADIPGERATLLEEGRSSLIVSLAQRDPAQPLERPGHPSSLCAFLVQLETLNAQNLCLLHVTLKECEPARTHVRLCLHRPLDLCAPMQRSLYPCAPFAAISTNEPKACQGAC